MQNKYKTEINFYTDRKNRAQLTVTSNFHNVAEYRDRSQIQPFTGVDKLSQESSKVLRKNNLDLSLTGSAQSQINVSSLDDGTPSKLHGPPSHAPGLSEQDHLNQEIARLEKQLI